MLTLVESETLVLVDSLNDVLALSGRSLVDVDALSDVDVLVESETLVLVEPLNDVLALVDSLSLLTLMHFLMWMCLLILKDLYCRAT